MSQPLSRLFEKWVSEETTLTFGEWIAERRERGKARHRAGAAIPVPSGYFAQMQNMQGQQLLLYQQRQSAMMQGLLGGLLGTFGR